MKKKIHSTSLIAHCLSTVTEWSHVHAMLSQTTVIHAMNSNSNVQSISTGNLKSSPLMHKQDSKQGLSFYEFLHRRNH